MGEPELYRCCKTCEYRDGSYYGCSKADVCYNGFSAYQPNAKMRAFEKEKEPASAATDTSSSD